ncbi:hypothetical protein GW846_03615 [Candidatus Gracilibacteria bacterium]|nr:hypothetical protein [Candidatus Gracilibacteria bacterium]
MFGRKLLFLASGYIAGNVVASMYGKNKNTIKKVQSKEDVKLMVDNFLATQKSFISDVEQKYVSDENREKIAAKKADFKQYAEKYQKQGQQLIEELQKNKEVGKEKAQGLFSSFLSSVRDLISSADDSLDSAERKLAKADSEVKELKKETKRNFKKM